MKFSCFFIFSVDWKRICFEVYFFITSIKAFSIFFLDSRFRKKSSIYVNSVMITKVIMMKKYLESSKQLIENCEFLYVPTVRLTSNSKFFQVYCGTQTSKKNCKFGLGLQGLNAETAGMLKIIDLPSCVLFSNGTIR